MGTEHTQGSLTKEAIRLAWPAVCESFFIALAGMVDTFMVSTLGANAVAAVGLTTQPKFPKTIDTDPVSRRISQLQVTGDQVKTVIQWQQSVEKCCIFG